MVWLNALTYKVSIKVVAGAVLKHSRDFNMTREVVLSTDLAPETPAYDIQIACGTGLQVTLINYILFTNNHF